MDKSPPPIEQESKDQLQVVKFIHGSVSPSINHFTHDHPLQLTTLRVSSNLTIITYCCGVSRTAGHGDGMSDLFYVCKLCNFFIHKSCSELPQYLNHQSHNHQFKLFSYADRDAGWAICDACNTFVFGFCYRCVECDYDIHPSCAFQPLTITNGLVHNHQLYLAFNCTPKNARDYSCSRCRRYDWKRWWVYRCSEAECKFNIHLNCARIAPTRVIGSTTMTT